MYKNVAVIDKTGRGHSICDALIRTNKTVKVFYIPGTGGFFDSRIETVSNIDIDDAKDIAAFCRNNDVKLVFVSHIEALTANVADSLRAEGLPVVGASADATRLESSKWFCKELCSENGIKTPDSMLIECEEHLHGYLDGNIDRAYMIKADWLTRNGNGAIRVRPSDAASDIIEEINLIMQQNPGYPYRFIVEDFLDGYDYSAHYFLNKSSVVSLPSSKDFKKSHDQDAGANCDGMGSISPHPMDDEKINTRIRETILDPLLKGLRSRNIEYDGPIYLGIRVDHDGVPNLLEVNTRMGDSESEVIFPRVNEDIHDLLYSLAKGFSVERKLSYMDNFCLSISLVSGDRDTVERHHTFSRNDWPYVNSGPGYEINLRPESLPASAKIYWANAEMRDGELLKTGTGRVAHLTATGSSLAQARSRVYSSLKAISFKNMRWRTDIGLEDLGVDSREYSRQTELDKVG